MRHTRRVSAATPYMARLRDILRATEPELWQFFASAPHVDGLTAQARACLLRSTYRLDDAVHADVLSAARDAAKRLGVTDPVAVYQAREGTAAPGNAHVVSLPGEAHVVFSGGTLELLDPGELRAVLGHELAHHALWTADGGDFWVLDRLVHASAQDPEALDVHEETARLLSLNTELVADRGALQAAEGDVTVAVAALVKLDTGLRTVSGEAYLRQAEEIIGLAELPDDVAALTHPDGYLRAWALARWAADGAAAEAEIARRVHGRLDLGRLDLVGQHQLTDLARRLVAQMLEPTWARTDATLAHARQFGEPPKGAAHVGPADLEPLGPTAVDFLGYVLLDMATVDDDLRGPGLAAALLVSERLAMAERFDALVASELELTRAEVLDRRAAAASALPAEGSA